MTHTKNKCDKLSLFLDHKKLGGRFSVSHVINHKKYTESKTVSSPHCTFDEFFSDMAIPQQCIYLGSEKSLYLPNHTRYSKVTGIFEKPTKFRFRKVLNQYTRALQFGWILGFRCQNWWIWGSALGPRGKPFNALNDQFGPLLFIFDL